MRLLRTPLNLHQLKYLQQRTIPSFEGWMPLSWGVAGIVQRRCLARSPTLRYLYRLPVDLPPGRIYLRSARPGVEAEKVRADACQTTSVN